MSVFEETESQVRSYSRSFPEVFDKAVNAYLYDVNGKKYVDFFAGAFHGMTMGSLSATTDVKSRNGAGVPLQNTTFVPYCNQFGDYKKSLEYLEWILSDDHSGVDKPACIILETIQAEGGVNVAEREWLQGIRRICDKYDILMVVDDIQVGIGRNGTFFSWEKAGIVPDMVTLSKSISGLGFPMSLLLIKPEYDVFQPSEHNGTFRGFQLSFVSAKAGIEFYINHHLDEAVQKKSEIIKNYLTEHIQPISDKIAIRGSGLIWGIDLMQIQPEMATAVMNKCFELGLILERAGRMDSVVKILPPLTIEEDTLLKGLDILRQSVEIVIKDYQ